MQRRRSLLSPLAALSSLLILGAAAAPTRAALDPERPLSSDRNYWNQFFSIPTGGYATPAYGTGAGPVIYAAPTGAGTGNAPNSPTSLPSAISRANATTNATIVLRGGDYRDVSDLFLEKPMTLQPYLQEKVWIKGSKQLDGTTGWTAVSNGSRTVYRRSWTFSFPGPARGTEDYVRRINDPTDEAADKENDPDYRYAGKADMVFINNQAMIQVGSVAEINADNKFYVDYGANLLYIGQSPRTSTSASKLIEATAYAHAFELLNRETNGRPTVTLRSIGFMHYAGHVDRDAALLFAGPESKLLDCTFVWNAVKGAVDIGGRDQTIQDCVFSCNGETGVSAAYTQNLLVQNNEFSYNNVEHFKATWSAAGFKFSQQQNAESFLTCRDNHAHHNYAAGLWADIWLNKSDIVFNTVHDNEGIGIFAAELSDDIVVAFNTCYNNGAGILVADSTNTQVWNNTLYNNKTALVVKNGGRANVPGNDAYRPDIPFTFETAGTVAKNNLFSGGSSAGGFHVDATPTDRRNNSPALFAAGSSLDFNLYHRPGYTYTNPTNPQNVIRWDTGAGDVSYQYRSDLTNASANRFESNGWGSTVGVGSVFVDAANANFNLSANADNPARTMPVAPLSARVAGATGYALGATPPNIGAKQN